MQLTSNSLLCDCCNAQQVGNFTYYSFDFYHIVVQNRVKQPTGRPCLSADLCGACMKIYKDRVIETYRPPQPNQFFCEISGQAAVADNIEYYRCAITEAIVKLDGQPCICDRCGSVTKADRPCAKCGPSATVTRTAEVTTDDKFLEINFGSSMFEKFKIHLQNVKALGEGKWVS